MGWRDTLRTVLQQTYEPLQQRKVDWMLVGSAASALRGVNLQPGDVDISTRTPDGVEAFRELLITYSLPAGAMQVSSALTEPLPSWRSTHAQPMARWTEPNGNRHWLCRWPIGDTLVDVSCMVVLESRDKLVEYYGETVWQYVQHIQFEDWSVPIVPLEVQLAYVAKQGQVERIRKIADYLKQQGFDKDLLERALHDRPPKEAIGQLLNQTLGIPIEY